MNLFIKSFLCLMFVSAVVKGRNICVTPAKEPGKCIPASQCNLHVYLQQHELKQLSDVIINYLKKSVCGRKNNKPFVCCAARHVIIDSAESSEDDLSKIQPAEDGITQDIADFEHVVDHPSLSLVNQGNCGSLLGFNKVFGGNDADLGEFPWVVQLQYPDVVVRCGGSLISKRYVLTAAHCTTDRDPVVSVRLGEYDTSKDIDCIDELDNCFPPVQEIPIEKIIRHPEFNNPKFSNDIALLRLQKDADINENVFPICLPTTPKLQTNTLARVIIAGWGLTEEQKPSKILQKASLKVVPNEECRRLYQNASQVTPRQICAGGENSVDSCRGDSGGPLFFWGQLEGNRIQYIQYGVVSARRVRDCGETHPGFHANVPYYMKWILDQMTP